MKTILGLRKRNTVVFNVVLFALFSLLALSCDKLGRSADECVMDDEPSVLSISIEPETRAADLAGNDTRASGDGHGVQADDNAVQTLEFFIFKADGSDAGMLDTYKKFQGSELSDLNDIKINTTTGLKIIYAVANSHRDSWKDVRTLVDFRGELSMLENEELKNFTMIGNAEVKLQVASSVTLSISRLVARIELTNIKTDFAGTPYEGSVLENVKVYLINVYADKMYGTGESPSSPSIFNYKKYVAEQTNLCNSGIDGMLYDEISQNISDEGYDKTHYFYCYENTLSAESETRRFTKLVIQGDLRGRTYYYPICINQADFGYSASNGHTGVKRNTSYSMDVTISRPGSTDPDKKLEYGVLTTKLNVLDWNTVPVVHVNF